MDKRKISVISSYAYITIYNNYGALLQYYALEQYLKQRNLESSWIRFRFRRACFPFVQLSYCRKYIPHFFILWGNLKTHNAFMRFCNRKITCSKRTFTGESALEKYSPEADCYISGSDQVFGGTSEPNFLRFVRDNHKKIAYAASFGRDVLSDEQIAANVPEWIKEFRAVSVREESGVVLCESIGVKAVHVLDPTLLVDVSVYAHLFKMCKQKKKYLRAYFMNIKSKRNVFYADIKAFIDSKGYGLKITAVGEAAKLFPVKYLCFPSPEKWIESYANAECVVTNTFHGMVFAIIFHKPFAVVMQKGLTASANNRFYSLLRKLHLENCIFDGEKCSITDYFDNLHIDWKKVDDVIHEERKKTDLFFSKVGL